MSSQNIQVIITNSQSGNRLDKFIQDNKIIDKSRSAIQNYIIKGDVKVNDLTVKTGYKLKENDKISINLAASNSSEIKSENIKLDIIFEDDKLLVINKPAGMIVHPGAGNSSGTLVNALLYHSNKLSNMSSDARPGIVHRLDKDTSGLLVVAKDNETHIKLQKQFKTRDIKRIYYAIVWGVPINNTGIIETYIARSRRDRKKMTATNSAGKEAITNYKIVKNFKYLSILELMLDTGRTHQIRVHMNHINMPVFGDPVYNGRKSQLRRLPSHLQKRGAALLKKIDRQSLHAKEISFIHPQNGKRMKFKVGLPKDIKSVVDSIEDILLLK